MTMRNSILLLIGIPAALASLPAAAAGSSCNASDCLHNSTIMQKVQPTSVTADDKGDVTFFASQSGQLPNVVFVLDNSTSMYELPYDVAAFPNSAWVSKGATPNACGTTPASITPPTGSGCTSVSWNSATMLSSCHANTFFEGLRDSNGAAYNKVTTYAPIDSAFSTFFTSANVYKYMEWTSAAAGGTSNGTITFTPGGSGGTVGGTPNSYCNGLDNTAGGGGIGGSGTGKWSLTQRQRCQQCVDEAGYYIAPAATATEAGSGPTNNLVFKGNWLNFNPPKFLIARKTLTDFISNQTISATPVRVGVVSYDVNNVAALDVPANTTGFTARNDGGSFISAGMIPDCSVTNWNNSTTATQKTALLTAVRAISWGTISAPVATPLAETLFQVGQFFSGDNNYYTNNFGAQWLKAGFTAPTGNNKPLYLEHPQFEGFEVRQTVRRGKAEVA